MSRLRQRWRGVAQGLTLGDMTTTVIEIPTPSGSRRFAAEVRAEIGRLGINQAELARRMAVGEAWLSRRISPTSTVEITFEEGERLGEALGVSPSRLAEWWLPRLDSNQQPSGYTSAQVIDLEERRRAA